MSISLDFAGLEKKIKEYDFKYVEGMVKQVIGLTIEAEGIKAFVGEVCTIYNEKNKPIICEVVGFKEKNIILMPLGELNGIAPGCKVVSSKKPLSVKCSEELFGRVLDGLGRPLRGEEIKNGVEYPLDTAPPDPLKRRRIKDVIATGVRAVDGFLTCGEGQRIGIFAGSGVGKSTTLGMIAREAKADVNVISLIGERGREVLEFVEKDLGAEGLKKSIIVCATSDQPALVRLKGAFTATAIAEYFRDKGKKVILMMDSVTRFAMAQREIGLAIGEPPATKGYTPSVFAMMPRLMERSGMSEKGSITAFYTVLVDGDDFNEPIADAVRGILDGHIVLSRNLAAKNHYPAIDVLSSVSRLMSQIADEEHKNAASFARDLMATYNNSEDLINIGAYVKGSNEKVDLAIKYIDSITNYLKQGIDEHCSFNESIERIKSMFK
ncbi:flagellar protein export ATPase FliI [Clostridium aestuarii]|uniref:Flagellar protein export ATPase FliI n=1 Tax=Clostridium aestuarii TaxID=338193 RepID=A0ABT4D0V2_9CLOT|nr:flagellar protein export ATPase FliI [Clostridium aestuarii]MCY6483683.1 flagellar protein export ATPase FliI [Clostridium aestuarii]